MKRLTKAKTWSELGRFTCDDHPDYLRWRKVIIGALQNLGQEPTQVGNYPRAKWLRAWDGLLEYINALCGEYGYAEEKAEKDILAEVNNVRDICDDISLEEDTPKKKGKSHAH